jgi:hypothetical protein
MGATGWSYFTPYQPDAEKALQTLREQIFKEGAYGKTHAFNSDVLATLPGLKETVEQLRILESERLGGPERKFSSIEELLEAAAEDGTHSILDIEHTADAPDFGVAWPAPQAVVEEVFGTAKPSRADIEAKPDGLAEQLDLERWQAVYVVAYADGKPSEIYFEGVSGD